MAAGFPDTTRDAVVRRLFALTKDFERVTQRPKKTARAEEIMALADAFLYGFQPMLETGNYAPYYDEMLAQGTLSYNCTTLIPTIYILAQAADLDPRIVLFDGIQEPRQKQPWRAVHYALSINVGHQKRWLCDPFWDRLGPIIKEGEGYIQIAKRRKYEGCKRKFQTKKEISEEEFAQLMAWLKTPAGSLDALVAGQKIDKEIDAQQHIYAALMVYYNPTTHDVATRLQLPKEYLQDPFAITRMSWSPDAELIPTGLILTYAAESTWDSLIDPKDIAATTIEELKEALQELEKIIDIKKYERLGTKWNSLSAKQQKRLEEIAETMMKKIELNEAAQTKIAARTLYEHEAPEQARLYGASDHIRLLRERVERYKRVRDEFNIPYDAMEKYLLKPKGKRAKEEQRILMRELEKANKKREKAFKQLDRARNFREGFEAEFSQERDLRLFDRRVLKKMSPEEIRARGQAKNLHIGYLALLTDFKAIPKLEDEITLQKYRVDISRRIAAQQSKV